MLNLYRTALLIGAVVFASGCVTGTRSLELPTPMVETAEQTAGTIYISTIEDSRQFEQKPAQASTPSVTGKLADTTAEQRARLIGRQRNGYGKAMGDVALANESTVQQEVRRLLEAGFKKRGYAIVTDLNADNVATVDIQKFWGWFRPGFASVGFESDIQCGINVETADKAHTLVVSGHALNKGQVASDANWIKSFRLTIEDFMANLDAALTEAGL